MYLAHLAPTSFRPSKVSKAETVVCYLPHLMTMLRHSSLYLSIPMRSTSSRDFMSAKSKHMQVR